MLVALAALAAASAAAPAGPCVHVMVPCYKCDETIRSLVHMVHLNAKHHWCVDMVIVVDWAGMDRSSKAAARATCTTYSVQCSIVEVHERKGPAHSKYIGFRYVSSAYGPNDLVMVIDGDDNLADERVIETVVGEMLASGAWVSTGMIVGKYSEQCAREWPAGIAIRQARWSFCHPRTMRVGLVANVSASDFQMRGSWMEKVTDRSWLYQAIDVATRKRFIKVTQRPLVVYVSRVDSTEAKVSHDYKRDALAQTAVTPVLPAFNEIHIVTVVFSRTRWLMRWLRSNVISQYQSLATHKLVPVVHFVCQTSDVAEHAHASCAVVRALHSIECIVEVHAFNTGPWQRYVYMRRVYMQRLVDYFIMIDDDLVLKHHDGLLRVWHQRVERGIASWYGKIFSQGDDYWTDKYRTNDMRGAMNVECRHITKYDYCGAGLAVIDAQFWATFEYLAARTPHQYRDIEDVAASKLLADMGWQRRRLFVDVQDMNYDEASKPRGLWSTGFMRERKSEFFAMLVSQGWRMQHNQSMLEACHSKTHAPRPAVRVLH